MSKKSDQRKEVREKHPDWSLAYMADHLSEIADLSVMSETVPQYLKVIALSLHTLARIEHYRLKSDVNGWSHRAVWQDAERASMQERLEATEAIIQGDEGWGDV